MSRKSTLPIDNDELLNRALTHRSFANNTVLSSNERLEFLGDSILGMVIAEYLYANYYMWDQGKLSKAKATIVMEGSLAQAARELQLDKMIHIGIGEESAGGRSRASILADAFEAVIAAIYLDKGFEKAKEFILENLKSPLKRVAQGDISGNDYKSKLQEITQKLYRKPPIYRIISELGSPHDRTFTAEVIIENKLLGKGTGKSKKEAEQAAAKEALLKTQFEQ